MAALQTKRRNAKKRNQSRADIEIKKDEKSYEL